MLRNSNVVAVPAYKLQCLCLNNGENEAVFREKMHRTSVEGIGVKVITAHGDQKYIRKPPQEPNVAFHGFCSNVMVIFHSLIASPGSLISNLTPQSGCTNFSLSSKDDSNLSIAVHLMEKVNEIHYVYNFFNLHSWSLASQPYMNRSI